MAAGLGTATSQDASEPHSSCRMPQRAHVCGHMWGCQETFPSSPGALEPCPNSTRPVREPPGQVTTPCPRKGPFDLGGEGVAAAQKEGRLPELMNVRCPFTLHEVLFSHVQPIYFSALNSSHDGPRTWNQLSWGPLGAKGL